MPARPTKRRAPCARGFLVWIGLLAGWAWVGVRPCAAFSAAEIAALQEMQNLETALTFEYLDTGYFVSLETLDDLPTSPTQFSFDALGQGGGTFVIRPNKGYFENARQNLLPVWTGPYVTYQQGTIQTDPGPYDRGTPLDPWRNPYYFFSPLGLIRGDTGAVTQELYGSYFDRYTIVSLGADGVVSSDDIIWQIGVGVYTITTPALSALAGPRVETLLATTASLFRAPEGATITLTGYNLGATQGVSQILFGSTPMTIQTWSAGSITFQLPPGLSGQGAVTLISGAFQSNALQLIIQRNAVETWVEYE